jgi:hypothetical protein
MAWKDDVKVSVITTKISPGICLGSGGKYKYYPFTTNCQKYWKIVFIVAHLQVTD